MASRVSSRHGDLSTCLEALTNPRFCPPPPPPLSCSYGVLLWELASGKTPFVRNTKVDEASDNSWIWRAGFPSHLPPSCPPSLKDLIFRCLTRNPKDRPCWAEIRKVLACLQEPQATPESTPRPRPRRASASGV